MDDTRFELILDTKEKIGKQLHKTTKAIEKYSKNLNKFDIVLLSLSIQNAIHNAHLDSLRDFDNTSDDVKVGLDRKLQEYDAVCFEIMDNVLNVNNESPILFDYIPLVEMGAMICPKEEIGYHLEGLLKARDVDENKDFVYSRTTGFLGKYQGFSVVIIEDLLGKPAEKVAIDWFKLREMIHEKTLLKSALHFDYCLKIFIDSHGNKGFKPIIEKEFDVVDILERELSMPGMERMDYGILGWGTDIKEISQNNVNTGSKKGSLENVKWLKKERRTIEEDLLKLPEFPKTFKNFSGVELVDFLEIAEFLFFQTYAQRSCILTENKKNLIRKIRKKTTLKNKKKIEIVINKLENFFDNPYQSLFIDIGDNKIITSFEHTIRFETWLLDKAFFEYHDNDLKGKVFEARCRIKLKENGFTVCDDRVDIKEPMLEPQISQKLWGKVKCSTDLDVVGIRDNKLLIVECKEIKVNHRKLRRRKIHELFGTYEKELYWKAKELSKKFEIYKKYFPDEFIENVPRKNVRIIPMLICNFPIKGENIVPILIYKDMDKILEKIKGIEFNQCEEKVKFSIPISKDNSKEFIAFGMNPR